MREVSSEGKRTARGSGFCRVRPRRDARECLFRTEWQPWRGPRCAHRPADAKPSRALHKIKPGRAEFVSPTDKQYPKTFWIQPFQVCRRILLDFPDCCSAATTNEWKPCLTF